jgi:hypothetical protein
MRVLLRAFTQAYHFVLAQLAAVDIARRAIRGTGRRREVARGIRERFLTTWLQCSTECSKERELSPEGEGRHCDIQDEC